jgi:serine protease Do
MKWRACISKRRASTLAALLGVVTVANLRAAGLLETIDSEVSSLYEKSKDAIVKVHAERRLQINNLSLSPAHRVGTGFFITGDGLLLTTDAVVDEADACWIEWHGEHVPAGIVGHDPRTNVALLRIDPEKCVGVGRQMPFLREGNSDELRVGSMVIAIGFPFELPSAPSVGFVSGIDIKRGSHVFVTSHIRAGCKLSRGQGGGPLLNVRGEVVGIAVAADTDDQCYALPINAVQKVRADFLKFGQAQHVWVGLGIAERRKIEPSSGLEDLQLIVQQVFSNTPAAQAGFQDHDVLVRISTNHVRDLADVLNTIFYHRSGERVSFTVLRDRQEHTFDLTVGTQPVPQPIAGAPLPQSSPNGPSQLLTIVPAAQSR